MPASAPRVRRSPCPVARTLDLIGDRWTLLLIRDFFRGAERYRDFATAPEGIPTNILAERLARLSVAGVIESTAPADGSRHRAYRLTPKGRALGRVLAEMRDWGLTWEKGTRVLAGLEPAKP
ncbi:MAG TPA: helix-turn-helix domain-containing protein [Candidatus Didemnitutus sp.]|jgi:DNA-binding HxlR family transcriptional regulator